MALPTLADVRATARAWWVEARDAGRRPRLPMLRARLAALVTDPNYYLRVIVQNNAGTLTLVLTLEQRDPVTLAVISTINRSWTPDPVDRPGFDLDQTEDFAGTLAEQGLVA